MFDFNQTEMQVTHLNEKIFIVGNIHEFRFQQKFFLFTAVNIIIAYHEWHLNTIITKLVDVRNIHFDTFKSLFQCSNGHDELPESRIVLLTLNVLSPHKCR